MRARVPRGTQQYQLMEHQWDDGVCMAQSVRVFFGFLTVPESLFDNPSQAETPKGGSIKCIQGAYAVNTFTRAFSSIQISSYRLFPSGFNWIDLFYITISTTTTTPPTTVSSSVSIALVSSTAVHRSKTIGHRWKLSQCAPEFASYEMRTRNLFILALSLTIPYYS